MKDADDFIKEICNKASSKNRITMTNVCIFV